MREIPLAHRVHRRLRLFRTLEIPLHLRSDIQSLGIGSVEVHVVAAGIHRRQHGEYRLTRLQRDWIIPVRQTPRRQQPQHRHYHQTSKPTAQETTQESLPQDGHSIAIIMKIGGEHIQFTGSQAEGQTRCPHSPARMLRGHSTLSFRGAYWSCTVISDRFNRPD